MQKTPEGAWFLPEPAMDHQQDPEEAGRQGPQLVPGIQPPADRSEQTACIGDFNPPVPILHIFYAQKAPLPDGPAVYTPPLR